MSRRHCLGLLPNLGRHVRPLAILMSCGALLLSATGCASMLVRSLGGIDGGRPSFGVKAGAAAFDVVTLPVQAVVIAPLAIKYKLVDEPEIEKARQAEEEDRRLLLECISEIERNPEVAVSGDYLSLDASSREYRALCSLVQTKVTNNYPDSFFRYLYQNAHECRHECILAGIMRNPNVPQDCLDAEFERLMRSDGRDWNLHEALLNNPRLSTEQVELAAMSHSNNRVRLAATYSLPDRYVIMAADPDTDTNRLVALSTNGWSRIRAAVAANPSTPAEVLCCMISDADVDVRISIAVNPNTPSDVFRDLLSDPNETISSVARRTLDSRSRHARGEGESAGASRDSP